MAQAFIASSRRGADRIGAGLEGVLRESESPRGIASRSEQCTVPCVRSVSLSAIVCHGLLLLQTCPCTASSP